MYGSENRKHSHQPPATWIQSMAVAASVEFLINETSAVINDVDRVGHKLGDTTDCQQRTVSEYLYIDSAL